MPGRDECVAGMDVGREQIGSISERSVAEVLVEARRVAPLEVGGVSVLGDVAMPRHDEIQVAVQVEVGPGGAC